MRNLFYVAALSLLSVTAGCNGGGDTTALNTGSPVPVQSTPTAPATTASTATAPAPMTGDDRAVSIQQLPAQAQAFIKQHFADKTPTAITADNDDFNVFFAGGEKVEFDLQGNWKDVDCRGTAVPQAIVPQAITAHTKQTAPNAVIVKIEHDYEGYDVRLNNGMKIEYNPAGQPVEYDD